MSRTWIRLAYCVAAALAFAFAVPAGEQARTAPAPARTAPKPKTGAAKAPGEQSKAKALAGTVRPATAKNFDKAVNAPYTIAYFWATWCGPCKMQAPIMETVAKKYKGKVRVIKIDVDAEKPVAEKYQVGSIPTIIVFKDGKAMYKLVGVTSEKEFDAEMEELGVSPAES